MHKRRSGNRGKMKEDCKFRCKTCADHQTDIVEYCPYIKLNLRKSFVIMVTQQEPEGVQLRML